MLKSHTRILQYLEEPDLPSAFQNEPISFLGNKYLVCFSHAQERTKQKHIFS